MNKKIKAVLIPILFMMFGCARIDFGKGGLTYYDSKPYLFVATTQDCVTTATVVLIPATTKHLVFKSGYGSSNLSVTLTNGMITNVGQQTDTKIPETLATIPSLVTAASGVKGAQGKQLICTPTANLYPINNSGANSGKPDMVHPIPIPLSIEVRKPNQRPPNKAN